jgi:L-lactate dehydrogenase complex protein LldG
MGGTVNSRDAILKAMRRNAPPVSPLPEPPTGIAYDDPEKQFEEVFTSVGGRFFRVANSSEANEQLKKIEVYAQASRIVSLVDGIGTPNVDLSALHDPHELEGVQYAILPAEFGVAENGAVWVPGSTLGPLRAIFVIAEHIALVVPAGQIVHNMHEAYERLTVERPGFSLFICGPSKTADIEQSLVIGAHGPRSCTLFLLG